jgi:Tfp pilus assembly protein PilF
MRLMRAGTSVGGLVAACAALGAASGSVGCAAPSDGVADPKSVAVYDVARDEFGKGNLREALAKVNEALEADSDNADAAYLGAIIHLAFCAKDEQSSDCRFPEAEKFARHALDSSPEMRDAKNVLGVILVHEKRYDDAIAVLKPLTEDILYPSPEKSWGNLGWAYLEKGQTNEAIDALLRAVASQPAFCVGNYRLGVAYHKAGDLKASREALTRALETDRPGCKTLQDALLLRGQVAAQLKDLDAARADFDKCSELSKATLSGERCLAELKVLGGPLPKSPPPSAPPPAPSDTGPAPTAPPASSAPATSPSAAPPASAAPAPAASGKGGQAGSGKKSAGGGN